MHRVIFYNDQMAQVFEALSKESPHGTTPLSGDDAYMNFIIKAISKHMSIEKGLPLINMINSVITENNEKERQKNNSETEGK